VLVHVDQRHPRDEPEQRRQGSGLEAAHGEAEALTLTREQEQALLEGVVEIAREGQEAVRAAWMLTHQGVEGLGALDGGAPAHAAIHAAPAEARLPVRLDHEGGCREGIHLPLLTEGQQRLTREQQLEHLPAADPRIGQAALGIAGGVVTEGRAADDQALEGLRLVEGERLDPSLPSTAEPARVLGIEESLGVA
jgi:hypothetical protein